MGGWGEDPSPISVPGNAGSLHSGCLAAILAALWSITRRLGLHCCPRTHPALYGPASITAFVWVSGEESSPLCRNGRYHSSDEKHLWAVVKGRSTRNQWLDQGLSDVYLPVPKAGVKGTVFP